MKVVITGWNVGFQKIRFTELLRTDFGFSLSAAKAATDAVLGRKSFELEVQAAQCGDLVPRLERIGVRAAFENDILSA